MENLRFKFPGMKSDVLKNITLQIEPGEKIILSGSNGAGKTTLLRIMSGLLIHTEGSFFINDDTFQKINLAQYRSQTSTIIHGETPFEGSLLENITFNDSSISMEDLKWALDSVQLTPYIKTLPEGLDTKIFPEGKQLSSSNAQKILLARSIVRKPKILFYEDPTDKMDDEAAKAIIDFIFSQDNKWTVIVSSANSHWQLKSSRHVVMEKGRIISDTKK